ncbi:hypothetical protein [Paenibacillus sp. UASWS1643]|uniref:hypothetical protein n=1 Tax=Paenibacillus sp. UASWS1643 TaxID=2580422 RepID=UPI00123A45B9|nr:hypothetical protein [Paenibacillus sp. UASWS1643]KAA8745630.1 hypothetical protein FE296_27675 [Paenibacillus sp. UASWS1643]
MKRLGQWNITALVLVLVLAMFPFSNVSHAAKAVTEVEGGHLSTNFEDGTLQGWTPRTGNERLTVTQQEAHEGQSSMLLEPDRQREDCQNRMEYMAQDHRKISV